MAALARPTIDVLVAAHGDREAVLKALDVAERAGVVRLDDSRIRFAHPLHASICYQQAPVWKRQAVHRRLAYAVSDLEERALHLARAADGDDADVAAALEAAAEGAGARGAPAAGAELCELAVALTPALLAAESRRRMKQAAIFHRLSGDVERSISLLEVLRSEIPGGPDKADVLVELCETRRFSLPAVLGLCEEALAEAAGDDGRSARVRLTRTQSLLMNGAVGPALEDARAALVLGELIQDPEVIAMAIARIGHAETSGAAVTPGLTERGIEVERGLQGGLQYLDSPRASHARQAMRIGNLEESRFLLEELASAATERGDERTHAQTLGSLALVEWFAGRWNIALAHAREAYESMEQTGEGHGAGASGRTQALIEADLGLVDRARARAEEGVAASREMSDDFFEISALGVLGRLELMLGNAEAASVLLRPLPQRLIDLGINDPTVPVWPDALEALAAVGDLAAARVWLDRWDKQARLIGSPWGMATAERCRGLILAADGDFARAAEAFEDALRVLEGYGYPLERGRTLLCMGSVLRQAQQRAAARERAGAGDRDLRRARGPSVGRASPSGARSHQRPPRAVGGADRNRAAGRRARGRREQQGDRRVTPSRREHGRGALVERVPKAEREARRACVEAERAHNVSATAATIGHETELAAIDAFLDGAGASAQALVLVGEAGIGKTTLWEHAVEAARAKFCSRPFVPRHRSRVVAFVRRVVGSSRTGVRRHRSRAPGATPARAGSSSAAR